MNKKNIKGARNSFFSQIVLQRISQKERHREIERQKKGSAFVCHFGPGNGSIHNKWLIVVGPRQTVLLLLQYT